MKFIDKKYLFYVSQSKNGLQKKKSAESKHKWYNVNNIYFHDLAKAIQSHPIKWWEQKLYFFKSNEKIPRALNKNEIIRNSVERQKKKKHSAQMKMLISSFYFATTQQTSERSSYTTTGAWGCYEDLKRRKYNKKRHITKHFFPLTLCFVCILQ